MFSPQMPESGKNIFSFAQDLVDEPSMKAKTNTIRTRSSIAVELAAPRMKHLLVHKPGYRQIRVFSIPLSYAVVNSHPSRISPRFALLRLVKKPSERRMDVLLGRISSQDVSENRRLRGLQTPEIIRRHACKPLEKSSLSMKWQPGCRILRRQFRILNIGAGSSSVIEDTLHDMGLASSVTE